MRIFSLHENRTNSEKKLNKINGFYQCAQYTCTAQWPIEMFKFLIIFLRHYKKK